MSTYVYFCPTHSSFPIVEAMWWVWSTSYAHTSTQCPCHHIGLPVSSHYSQYTLKLTSFFFNSNSRSFNLLNKQVRHKSQNYCVPPSSRCRKMARFWAMLPGSRTSQYSQWYSLLMSLLNTSCTVPTFVHFDITSLPLLCLLWMTTCCYQQGHTGSKLCSDRIVCVFGTFVT